MSKSQVIDNEPEEEQLPTKSRVGLKVLREIIILSNGLVCSLWQVYYRGRIRGVVLWTTGPASNRIRGFAPFVTYNNAIPVMDAMSADEDARSVEVFDQNHPPLAKHHDLYVTFHGISLEPSFNSLLDEAPLEPGAF